METRKLAQLQVGDKVRLKSKQECINIMRGEFIIGRMSRFCEKIVTVSFVCEKRFYTEECPALYFTLDCIEDNLSLNTNFDIKITTNSLF